MNLFLYCSRGPVLKIILSVAEEKESWIGDNGVYKYFVELC